MRNGKRHLTEDDLIRWRAFYEAYPGWKKRWELVAEYARAQGGLVLAFWRLKVGPAFGEDTWYSVEACAEELDVPVSELKTIYSRTMRWVRPRLRKDPEWRKLHRTPRHQLIREFKAKDWAP